MASGWQSEVSLAALKEQRRRQREELLAEVGGPAPAGSLQPLGPGLGAGEGAGGSPWEPVGSGGRAGAGRRVISGGLCWAVGPGFCLLYARAWEEADPAAQRCLWSSGSVLAGLVLLSLPTSQSRRHRGGVRYMQVSPRAHRELFLSSRASLV